MKSVGTKIIVTTIAIMLVIFIITMFNLDASMEWNIKKIISCIIISIWGLFLPQTFTYFICMVKNSSIEYSVRLGYTIGLGAFLGLLLAPYYGIKFYFINLEEIKWNGEFIW